MEEEILVNKSKFYLQMKGRRILMGYCIELEKSTISVTKENAIQMMDMLAGYIPNHKVDWRWVNEKYLTDLCKEHNFEEVTEELRYPMYEEDGIYKIDYFSGEKLGNDYEMFKLIAPYINDGYIEMSGEDAERWRWIFKDGKCEEKFPKIKWD